MRDRRAFTRLVAGAVDSRMLNHDDEVMAWFALLIVYSPTAGTPQLQRLAEELVVNRNWTQHTTPFTYSKTFVADTNEAKSLAPAGAPDPESFFDKAANGVDAKQRALAEARAAVVAAGILSWRIHLQVGDANVIEDRS